MNQSNPRPVKPDVHATNGQAARTGEWLRHYSPQNAEWFKQVLKDFVDQPDAFKIQGTYRGQSVTLYTDPSYGKVVVVSPGGVFVSGWRLNTDQSRNLRQRHSL